MNPEESTRLSTLAEAPSLFIEPPPAFQASPQKERELQRLIRKFDPVQRDFLNRSLGKAGEELVLDFERRNLIAQGRSDLAHKIRWVSQEDGDGAGYDIRSYDVRGGERLLEVKTTNGIQTTPFYLTRNELAFSKERPKEFRICRLYDFAKAPRMFELAAPIEGIVRLVLLSQSVAAF